MAIPHAEPLPLAESVTRELERISGFQDTEIFYTTPIISTHTGVGAIGFTYFAE